MQNILKLTKSAKTGDEPKDKRCPHCEQTFYYEKGLKIHLSHAHSVPDWPPDMERIDLPGHKSNICVTNFTPNEVLGKNGLIEPDKNVDERLDKSPSGLRLKPKIDMEMSAPDDKLGTNMDAELGINENECTYNWRE